MFTNNKLSKEVSIAIAFGASALSSNVVMAQEEGADKIERVSVTGSRIKRTDLETASPVSVFDIKDIANSGSVTVAEFLLCHMKQSTSMSPECPHLLANSHALIWLQIVVPTPLITQI